ncbi:MAG: CHAT domain-containing protein [Cyanobacteria bacterium J06641_5]
MQPPQFFWKLSLQLSIFLPVGGVRAQTDFLGAGQALFRRGNLVGAVELWQQQAASQQDRRLQAKAQANLALAYEKLGRPDAAETAIAAGFELLEALPERDRTAISAQLLNARGSLAFLRGQQTKALATWQQAEAAYDLAADPLGVTRVRVNQAQALQAQGRLRQAGRLLAAALSQLPEERLALRSSALHQEGVLATRLGESDRAQNAFEASLQAAEASDNPETASAALLGLGNLARASRPPEAIALYQQAAERSADPARQLEALVNAFGAAVETEAWPTIQTLQPQIDALLAIAPVSQPALFARLHLARAQMAALDQGEAPVAAATIAELLADTYHLAQRLSSDALESRALGTLGNLYERQGQLEDALGPTRQALALAESAQAPEIAYRWQWQLGRLLESQGDRLGAIAAYDEAVALLQTLRGDLIAIDAEARFSFRSEVEPVYREFVSLLLATAADSGDEQTYLALARETIEALQVAELVNFFRIDCEIGQLAQIERLDPQAAIIYPILLADRVEIVLSVPGQPLASYRSEVGRDEFLPKLRRWQAALKNPTREHLPTSQQLYDWLLRPLAADLARQDLQTLTFVLDGPLRNVPMSALHDGDRYLIEQYAVAVAPGLQLVDPDPEPEDRSSLQAILAGLTEGRQGFIPLPGVGKELEQIQSLIPSKVLLDRAFDEAQFLATLQASPVPIVHLATHGQFGSRPEDTFLLTWDDRIELTELNALLQNRQQEIELLILSACETAKGDDRAALGLAGVAVRAGARSTIASLWQVSDIGTTALMQNFYQQIVAGPTNKAEALRQAQLAQLRDAEYAHPFFWSSFVLIGNWL